MLDQKQQHSIPLKEEIQYIQSYLDIEQVRFQDRLAIKYEIADNTLDCIVPNLILQPLVENALKHGFSRRIDAGWIRLKSEILDQKQLLLIVEDDGEGLQENYQEGIGLKNVQERLKQMYGEQASLTLLSPEPKGCMAQILIPIDT